MTIDDSADDTLVQQQVADYLAAHPDFLKDHRALLEVLEIPHISGGASLIEKQVQSLQDEVRKLRGQLKQFRTVATENQQILERMHQIQLEMVQCESLDELLDRVGQRLGEEFGCRQVSLALVDGDGLPEHALLVSPTDEPSRAALAELTAVTEPLCGRLSRQRLELLFAANASEVQSAVCAPLDPNVAMGVLALGSTREDQFHPGMGTLFLSLMAQTLGHCLAQQMPEGLKQQA